MIPEKLYERRKSDVDLTEIKLDIREIATLQKVYVDEIKICRKETTEQGKAIASIKVKVWIGCVGVVALVGNAVRKLF